MTTDTAPRATMNGKPVFTVPAKSVINFDSGFKHKLLCDGPTFSTGVACPYTCEFCYVPSVYRKLLDAFLRKIGKRHEEVVIRRENALASMRSQLLDNKGRPKFTDPEDKRVIYSSPATDVAGNMDLVRETIEACKLILTFTNWHIRLLSKSNLLPKIALALEQWWHGGNPSPRACSMGTPGPHARVIYGVSTGTLDDNLAAAFETGTPKVSKRLESLHWLQDNGFRTFGMICPSLPQGDYPGISRLLMQAVRPWKCEHIWAEVINVRGESMTRTCEALRRGGFNAVADGLHHVSTNPAAWEQYSRDTFEAHKEALAGYDLGKLRFLQYVNKNNRDYWQAEVSNGAVLL